MIIPKNLNASVSMKFSFAYYKSDVEICCAHIAMLNHTMHSKVCLFFFFYNFQRSTISLHSYINQHAKESLNKPETELKSDDC